MCEWEGRQLGGVRGGKATKIPRTRSHVAVKTTVIWDFALSQTGTFGEF